MTSRRFRAPWDDKGPIRAELFGTERLEHHAETLAAAQRVIEHAPRVASLSRRLRQNVDILLHAYRACADEVQQGRSLTPAAEWLLDNFHLVDLQLQQITKDLPPGYYRQLPKLADGHLAGYPRLVGMAWAYVAHTDSLIAEPALRRFVQAYQRVTPLQIGELWALAISLRIILVENMRRLAVEIVEAQNLRRLADALVDRVTGLERESRQLQSALAGYDPDPLPEILAAQLARRLRGTDPAQSPLHGWLEQKLHRQGTVIEDVVSRAVQRQGATNVTMRNIVTSMRILSVLDWAEFVERVSLVDARLRASSGFAAMDFATRNIYRTAVEDLARNASGTSRGDELAVTDAALQLAARGTFSRAREPGYFLIGKGRATLEASVGYRPVLWHRVLRSISGAGVGGYIAAVFAVAAASVALALGAANVPGGAALGLALLALPAALSLSGAVVNDIVTRTRPPHRLPAMRLSDGIPDDLRTLVAVPALLNSETEVLDQIGQLEVHHLSSIGGAIHFALLSDGPDATIESSPSDRRLVETATNAIAALNRRYPMAGGTRFLFLHRRRLWNPAEGRWMGWERKRGKLHELNRLLRGASDTTFVTGLDALPDHVRFVITLDADTRLLHDTVRALIGKMAHPLNHAQFDEALQRVTEGYGILQPRVTPALPVGHQRSIYQRVHSSPGGIDPYAAAISEVYQDLFGEGSFTGKGIYDIDAFTAAMEGRVPDNTMLSHDLFEGTFARSALASDVQVIEDYPARYDVAANRSHRWARGDWQLLPWLVGARGGDRGAVPLLGRWKMADNLVRTLVAPSALLALLGGWLLPRPSALAWTAAILCLLTLPRFIAPLHAMLPRLRDQSLRAHFAAVGRDWATALAQAGLGLVFLADQAWLMGDAILRTLVRLGITRRHLLEWVTAAQAAAKNRPGLAGQYRMMAGGVGLGVGTATLAAAANPAAWPLIAPFGVAWALAPLIAHRISRSPGPRVGAALTPSDARRLRAIGRKTWRYFENFVTEADSFLPPDNFQEIPVPALARRTSPTNIGLYLLSTVAARDMGWIDEAETLDRLERTFETMGRMRRFKGHFFNWYDTATLAVLDPAYVSSVDSGNLAGHLLAVAQACRDWASAAPSAAAQGEAIRDALFLARTAVRGEDGAYRALVGAEELLAAGLESSDRSALESSVSEALRLAQQHHEGSDASYWTGVVQRLLCVCAPPPDRQKRFEAIAYLADRFANAMDFRFLLDPEKELLSIGFSATTNARDPNCYDLLASEARLASLFAIAKKDLGPRHWFRLGRSVTPVGYQTALLSWSGSMFEYLMPSLVVRAPEGSLLAQTADAIVAQQQAHGRTLGIPWGISESSYNARDARMTYQYSNFGVPGLGLKRGLAQNRVIAPYATGLAAMVDPAAAVANFARLADIGAEGQYGFYEAVDFTPERVPDGASHVLVQSFMAHHQGMTIVAIANTLLDGAMRKRFHAVPMVKAIDLLMHERVPRDIAVTQTHAEEVKVSATDPTDGARVRRFDDPSNAPRTAHLLSNGRYGVMLTPTGAGYSRWRDLAVTRWRADPTTDHLGSFIYLRDVVSGHVWSAGTEPLGSEARTHSAVFAEHLATFVTRQGTLATTTEVVVSSEDDAEARRVTLGNTGKRDREIDVTSYVELVLAPAAADLAHPAFSKMFVVTDFLPELGVLIATRRRRSPGEPAVWVAHIAVPEGDETAPLQYETDRASFIGRGRSLARPAMATADLSGTKGAVLDPVFAMRRRVRVPAGGKARITFWTLVADSADVLLELVDRHRDPSAFDRASTLAWTQAQVQLRDLGITNAQAADFQSLAGSVLRTDARLRPPSPRILAGAGPLSGLWPLGISGDLPIVLLSIQDASDIDRVTEVLSAHEYWRWRQLAIDLVILNERGSSYAQDLQVGIDAAVRAAQARLRSTADGPARQGAVHVLRADLISAESRALLLSAARAILVASRGTIRQHIDALAAPPASVVPPAPPPSVPDADPPRPQLEFFNGLGGFAAEGREYVTVLRNRQTTPAPWINVVANPDFGFIASADGCGPVWAENSRENTLTPWSNDPVTDPPGDVIYLRDADSGCLWTPTAMPMRSTGTYVARFGFGYVRYEHAANGIEASLTRCVPIDDPVRVDLLTLHNATNRVRRILVTTYAEWVLGTTRSATASMLTTERDPVTGALIARNPSASAFPDRIAFADLGGEPDGFTCDRAEVLGPGGSLADPRGLRGQRLSGRLGAGIDACAAQQRLVRLQPGQRVDLCLLLGQARSIEHARALIARYRGSDVASVLDPVCRQWDELLGAVQVSTPDRAMDILLNGWLLYQTLACRVWARAGFYQASGAYGFRDQLQDGLALTFSRPDLTRAHLLRAAARQFPEGDVQHWWLPHSGQGVRTRISDDRVWLGYAAAHYVQATGDSGILDEEVPFLHGPPLAPGVHDSFFQPERSEKTASLFEHCARGLDQCIALTGDNGLPLIGTGDWNDGMNRVGEAGSGTSVWLGWLFITTVGMIAPMADMRDPGRATRWRIHADRVRQAIETEAWDGKWYRRGTFDDGAPLGAAASEECRIDSIAQSWAVLSGAARPDRAVQAMASVEHHLIRPDLRLALLFTPPFDRTPLDPGYIKGYPPGLRENGGQYSHAAAWLVLAYAELGRGDKAVALFSLLNPINHSLSPDGADRYKGEPYVMAADVYAAPAKAGRAGWTWYTGSAGWMYRAGVEGIIGLTRSGSDLHFDPCLPTDWSEVRVAVRQGSSTLHVTIVQDDTLPGGDHQAEIEGVRLGKNLRAVASQAADGTRTLRLCVRSRRPMERAMH